MKNPKKIYPNITKYGLEIKENAHGILYIEREPLNKVLKETGRWEAWYDWAIGITCIEEGIYPYDVEKFLAGRPNYD